MQAEIKYFIFLILSLIIISCNNKADGVLSEKRMQDVLLDIHIAEAFIDMDGRKYNNDSIKQVLFKSVFEKHNITQALYDSSLVWYAKDLETYLRLYDRVKADAEERLKALGDVQASIKPSSNGDSINIWPRRTSLILHPKALFNGVIFNVEPEVSFSSGSVFVLGMHVWGMDRNMKRYPEIRMSIVQGDSIIVVNDTIREDGYNQTIVRGIATQKVDKVFGHIRLDNAGNDYHKIYIDSLNLMKYNYGTIE